MALPVAGFYTSTGGIITTHDFGSVEAGAYKPDSSGWSFRLYNAYGSTSSDTMTSVKASVRDDDGGIDEIWTKQHWTQLKSNGSSTGVGMVDDAQTVFTPVGKNKELACGDIPSGEYRTLFARCYPPTDAAEQDVDFQLRVTYQQPATSIAKWITDLRGDGVVASTGTPFAMSTGGNSGEIPYVGGYALIDSNEIYFGSSGTFDCSTGSDGTNTVYLTESGSFGMTTGSTAVTQLPLYEATISSGVATALTDKRVYLAGLQAGTTGAMSSTPDLGDFYLGVTNGKLYAAKTAGTWTIIAGTDTFLGLTDTPADFTGDASKILTVTTGESAVEFLSSTGILLDNLGDAEDNTDLNASTGHHGLLLKFTAISTDYLSATGGYTAPAGSGNVNSSGAFTAGTLAEISTTGGNIISSPFTVTTGDVFDFGAHSAVFTEQAIATTTGTAAIDWNNGLKALFTRSTGADGVATFSFTAPVKSANTMLTIQNSSVGSTGSIIWPVIKWQNGSEPILTTGASAIDSVSFYYSTGLASYLGISSDNFST